MNQLSIDHEPSQKTSKLFMLSFFFMLGVSSLSGWNAILVGNNYFHNQFKGLKSEFYLPIPNYIGLTCLGVMMPKLSNYLSLQIRIAFALFLLSIMIIILPLVAQLMPNERGKNIYHTQGFYIDLFVGLLMGIFSCSVQTSSSGLAAMYGGEYVAIFYVGLGFSGILICSFQFISLAFIPSAELTLFITLNVSALLNVIAIIMFCVFKTTSTYKRGELIKKQNQAVFDQDNEQSLLRSQNVVKMQQMGFIKTFWWINKLAFPIPILVLVLYFQTFFFFPAIALQKQFPESFKGWGIAILLQCFNLGDTIGKALAGFRLYSKNCLIFFIIFRMIQFYPFVLIAQGIITPDYIAYLNLFSFTLIHGYINTGLMQLGPQMTSEAYIKEKIGFVNQCNLFFGITFGSLLAPPIYEYFIQ